MSEKEGKCDVQIGRIGVAASVPTRQGAELIEAVHRGIRGAAVSATGPVELSRLRIRVHADASPGQIVGAVRRALAAAMRRSRW